MKQEKFIYADAMASAPADPRVTEYMLPWLTGRPGNSSSKHRAGAEAAALVEISRKRVAEFWYAEPDEVIFTSGATESCNLALRGLAAANFPTKKHIISSETEHPAVYETLKSLSAYGIDVTFLKPGVSGGVSGRQIVEAIRPDTLAASIMAVNNETGLCNPMEEISAVCKQQKIWLHTDATQMPGRVARAAWLMGADLVSFGGHKCYAPIGCGGLIARKEAGRKIPLTPLFSGGGHEAGLRSGTHAAPLLAALGKAFELLGAEEALCIETLQKLTAVFIGALRERGVDFFLTGGKQADAAGCASLRISGVRAADLLTACGTTAFSAGSACSSLHSGGNRVLVASGLSPEEAECTVRVSFSRFTTLEEALELAERIAEKAKDLLN